MSAEKCGTPLTMEAFEEAVRKAQLPPMPIPVIVSPRAFKVLQKIRSKFPDFDPSTETEIWVKAYRIGLTEDE